MRKNIFSKISPDSEFQKNVKKFAFYWISSIIAVKLFPSLDLKNCIFIEYYRALYFLLVSFESLSIWELTEENLINAA